MTLKDIMAISGHSGLFKFVAQGRNGIIVESLVDSKRIQVSTSAKVSTLSDISIFTHQGEEPLSKVFEAIKVMEKEGPAIGHKSSNDEIKAYFEKVLPHFDQDRVYVSDMKKVIGWYNQLQNIGMLNFVVEEEDGVDGETKEGAEPGDNVQA